MKFRSCIPSARHKARPCGDTLDQNRIESEFASKGIKWKFITERSPWRGGWWERFCRAVKEPLRKVLGKALLTFTELNTLLVKIEGVINSRPLTAVSDDHRDLSPITPAHLAIGRPLNQLPEVSQENHGEVPLPSKITQSLLEALEARVPASFDREKQVASRRTSLTSRRYCAGLRR